MGTFYRDGGIGGKIECFTPDDGPDHFYFATGWMEGQVTLDDILETAKVKWGEDVDLSKIDIQAEHIHTNCIGYDRYDPGDYTNYLKISLLKG